VTIRPCYSQPFIGSICHYGNPPPDSIANQVWGKVSDTCNYKARLTHDGRMAATWARSASARTCAAIGALLVGRG
jgi:hypothetical protein